MNFTSHNLTCIASSKGQTGIHRMGISGNLRVVVLMVLVVTLAACNRSQQASSGLDGSTAAGTPTTSLTPKPPESAGSAVLNLERNVMFSYPTGSDFQREVGAIKLEFFRAEEGDLIVEGTGKTQWTEEADFPDCKFTGKAEGKVFVRGLFTFKDCMFHLTIDTTFSQPTVSNQSGGSCTGSIVFSETEFSSQIELDPEATRFKETKQEGWWEVTTVKLTELNSNDVKYCFIPEVIQ